MWRNADLPNGAWAPQGVEPPAPGKPPPGLDPRALLSRSPFPDSRAWKARQPLSHRYLVGGLNESNCACPREPAEPGNSTAVDLEKGRQGLNSAFGSGCMD